MDVHSTTNASDRAQDRAHDRICVLFATIDEEHANSFARQACQRRLVSCVNEVPGVRSTYWWEGELCEEREVVLWMEAPAHDVQTRIDALVDLHPYDTPKIVALPVAAAAPGFATWCLAETSAPARQPQPVGQED